MAKKPASFEYNGTLVKVLDGDTIDCYIDLGLRKTQMDKFTDKLERGMWSEQLRVPANKLNLGNLIAPIGSGKWVPSESSNLD
jgi:hypothetical protein